MRVYYRTKSTGNDLADKVISMQYEIFKLHVQLQLAPLKALLDNEKGMILIERQENSIEFVYKEMKPEIELICKTQLAKMKKDQKISF